MRSLLRPQLYEKEQGDALTTSLLAQKNNAATVFVCASVITRHTKSPLQKGERGEAYIAGE